MKKNPIQPPLLKTMTFLFVILTQVQSGPYDPLAECMLSTTIHELEYVAMTNTMQWNATFQSNCIDYLHHAYFVIPFTKFYPEMFSLHPSKVVLAFAGQDYVFKFMRINKDNSTNNIYLVFIFLIFIHIFSGLKTEIVTFRIHESESGPFKSQ